MTNNYIIITQEYRAIFYNTDNAKMAICKYAADIGIRIRKAILEKAADSLLVEDLVEIVNDTCLDYNDKIKQIITGYTTLYADSVKKKNTKECPDCKYFVGCEMACGGRPCDGFTEASK